MTAWHRPPADIDAPTFFTRWLLDAYAAMACRAAPDAPLLRVSLSGPGGGQWQIELDEERIEVTPLTMESARTAAEPEVLIRQSAADFLAAFHPGPELPELLPPQWSALDLLFLDPRDTALLRQISGRLAVEVTGQKRRRWTLDLAIGKAGLAAGRPRATVKLDGASYAGLAQGTLPPLQALLSGKVQVEGDRALAMQALLLLGAKLGR